MFSLTKLRKALSAFALCCLGVMGMGFTPLALADNPATHFQLDGNIKGGTAGQPDWSDIFDGSIPSESTGAGATVKSPLPSGFSSATFLVDFFPATSNDNSLYATGSKDTLNITPGWQCKKTNNVNDKTDINNAYAVATTKTGLLDGKPHQIVYFALDVASNDGTKDVGFWFLKDPNVSCPAGNGSTPFVGKHSDGDVLIVSEFTNGGRVSSIKAYKWVDDGTNAYLDPNPIGEGGECDAGSFDVCAKVNTVVLDGDGPNADVPWLVKSKTSNPSGPAYTGSKDLDIGMFFEGGIDMTALGISGCFNRYLADTRSSTSLGATIFDFTLGNFSNCSIKASKACLDTSYDVKNNNYTSTFSVVIENPSSSSGVVYDVSFNELNDPIPADMSCSIKDNNQTVANDDPVGKAVTNGGSPIKVADSLAPGTSVTTTITCTGTTNGFTNAIRATAGSADGQSDIFKTATQTNSCTAQPLGDLAVKKSCLGMELQAGDNGQITLNAKVLVEVSNPSTSTEQIKVDSVTDKDSSSNKVGTFSQKKCEDLTTDESKLELLPGETICFVGNYTPLNSTLVNPPSPSTAFFTDIATATAHGLAPGSNEKFEATSTQVSCFLCDSDIDGKPDVEDCLTDNLCFKPH